MSDEQSIPEASKPNRVIDQCPGCGTKFREGDENVKFVMETFAYYMGKEQLAPSMQKIMCLKCGITKGTAETLATIKGMIRAAKDGDPGKILKPSSTRSNIIIPGRA